MESLIVLFPIIVMIGIFYVAHVINRFINRRLLHKQADTQIPTTASAPEQIAPSETIHPFKFGQIFLIIVIVFILLGFLGLYLYSLEVSRTGNL